MLSNLAHNIYHLLAIICWS